MTNTSLPKFHPSHQLDDETLAEFNNALQIVPPLFCNQRSDRRDYGVDIQLEALNNESMTNLRVSVQLKGTDANALLTGVVTRSIDHSNLNYLAQNPFGLYVCYHRPTKSLLCRYADDILHDVSRSKKQKHQHTLTVHFSKPFDAAFQFELHTRLLGSSRRRMEERRNWESAQPTIYAQNQSLGSTPEVPTNPDRAEELLLRLRENGADRIVSNLFEEFKAAVRPEAMMHVYLSEIDIGMTGGDPSTARVRKGISIITNAVTNRKISPCSGYYAIGNAHLALRNFEEAIFFYDHALENTTPEDDLIIARIFSNRGSSYMQLGQDSKSIESYERAIEIDASLAEARMVLARRCIESHDYRKALEHLNHSIRRRGSGVISESTHGWRALVHFRLDNHQLGFQDIWSVINDAEHLPWAWPWCARLVSDFGTHDIASTRLAILFWSEFRREHPDHIGGQIEDLNCEYALKMFDATRLDFDQFRMRSLELSVMSPDDKPRLLDCVGHWAQVDDNWNDAESAFRIAFKICPEIYACCLGTALNFLGRFEEAIEVMLPFAKIHAQDAIVQFQLGVSFSRTDRSLEAALRFATAVNLDMDYQEAWFNLGGSLWSSSNAVIDMDECANLALKVWAYTLKQWPENELSYELKSNLPILVRLSQVEGEFDPKSILDVVSGYLTNKTG